MNAYYCIQKTDFKGHWVQKTECNQMDGQTDVTHRFTLWITRLINV